MDDAKSQMLQNRTPVPKEPISGREAEDYCTKKVFMTLYHHVLRCNSPLSAVILPS